MAAIGLAESPKLESTVMPFILRGVNLLGVSSANCPLPLKREIWNRLATKWKPPQLDHIATQEIALEDVLQESQHMLNSKTWGRTVVKVIS